MNNKISSEQSLSFYQVIFIILRLLHEIIPLLQATRNPPIQNPKKGHSGLYVINNINTIPTYEFTLKPFYILLQEVP